MQLEVVNIRNLLKVTPSVLCLGPRSWALNCLSLSPPRSSFWSFQLRLRPSSWPTYIFLVLQVAPACLPACLSISLISDSRVQLPHPPPAPTRGRACPRTQQALCPEGLKFLLGAGGLKNRRRQLSAWEAKGRR